jgi:hypothetical protein
MAFAFAIISGRELLVNWPHEINQILRSEGRKWHSAAVFMKRPIMLAILDLVTNLSFRSAKSCGQSLLRFGICASDMSPYNSPSKERTVFLFLISMFWKYWLAIFNVTSTIVDPLSGQNNDSIFREHFLWVYRPILHRIRGKFCKNPMFRDLSIGVHISKPNDYNIKLFFFAFRKQISSFSSDYFGRRRGSFFLSKRSQNHYNISEISDANTVFYIISLKEPLLWRIAGNICSVENSSMVIFWLFSISPFMIIPRPPLS